MDLFELIGTIAIKNGEAIDALNETSQVGEKTQSKLGSTFSKIGKGAAVVGKAIGGALVAGGAAMGGLVIKATNLSGELEQNMGGSEAVFGEYAAKMQETAKNAFSNMGLSTSDFLGTANKMGALFQGAGFSIEESSGLASDAMQRAADVASIMGIDTSAAMEAIAGAAKGNFTMMDNLGVAMNDTTLQAYALEKGIEKSTSEMTNQEKIGLAMEMFMEKTAYAAGNYAKENETLAGSLGTAKAALTNFLDGSGDVDSLVSAFSNAADVIIRNVTEIAPRLISGLTEVIGKVIPMISPLIAQLLPVVIEGAVSLVNGVVAAVPALVTALLDCIPGLLDGVQQIFTALVEALPMLMESIVSALPTLIPLLVTALVSMIVTLCNSFSQIIQPLIDYLPDIIIAIVDAIVTNLPILIDGIITLVMGIVEAIPQIIRGLVNALPTIISMIIESLLRNLPKIIAGLIQVVWGIVKSLPQIFGDLIKGVVNTLVGIFTGIKNAFAPVGNWINTHVVQPVVKFFTNLWNKVKNIWNNIRTAIGNAVSAVKDKVTTVFNAVKNTVSNVFNNIKSKISNTVNSIKTTVTNVFNKVKSAMEKPIQKARDTIKGIVDKIKGFFSGMKLNFPKIKMPHFKVSPSGWKIGDLLKGSIPKLGIEWYAKAMDNPMVMTEPTVFGYNPATGALRAGGESGSEVVSGTNTLMNMISGAVQNENAAMIQKLERIISLLVQFFPDALDAMRTPMVCDTNGLAIAMAPAMNTELGKITIKKGRGR